MENAPLTVLQARAAGVPILASDVEGIREFVEPGVHGILFPPGNALALADALREVILRRLVRTPHPSAPMSLEEHLRKITTLYAQLIASHGSREIA
jgi:glycosyltransferase involved in cell wall biosynthesis